MDDPFAISPPPPIGLGRVGRANRGRGIWELIEVIPDTQGIDPIVGSPAQ